MNQYLPEDIRRLLTATNELLERECSLIIIGGAAASLAYGATKTTTDIDLANNPPEALLAAIEQAKAKVGLAIPVQYVGVFDPPYSFEERLVAMKEPKLRKLHIFFPERHDLVLMKVVRGFENDLQTIEEIHKTKPLDLDILRERFMTEMTQVIGKPSEIRLNFLLMIERLFGPEAFANLEVITNEWSALKV